MNLSTTSRGFEIVNFWDRGGDGDPCSLQQSSAIDYTIPGSIDHPGSSAVWLGFDSHRMHLSRAQVNELVACLSCWLQQGSFVLPKEGKE